MPSTLSVLAVTATLAFTASARLTIATITVTASPVTISNSIVQAVAEGSSEPIDVDSTATTSSGDPVVTDIPTTAASEASRDAASDSIFVYGVLTPVPTQTVPHLRTVTVNDPPTTWTGDFYSTLYSTPSAVSPTMYVYANADCKAATDPATGAIQPDSVQPIVFEYQPDLDTCPSQGAIIPSPTAIPAGASQASWGSIYIPDNTTDSFGNFDANHYQGHGISCLIARSSGGGTCGQDPRDLLGVDATVELHKPPQEVPLELLREIRPAEQPHPLSTPLSIINKRAAGAGGVLHPGLWEYRSGSCFTFNVTTGWYINQDLTFNCIALPG